MSEDATGYEVATTTESLPIQSFDEMMKAGQLLAQSGMFGINNAAAGFVVVATCKQQGISLMEFARTYWIVQGRPTMKADAMLAEFRKKGGKCKILSSSTTRAAAAFAFEGQSYDMEYTIDDAKRTGDALKGDGSLKDMWKKRPEDMLWARLVSRSVRKLAPEIVAGIYTPEEVQDFAPTTRPEPRRIDPSEIQSRVDAVKMAPPKNPNFCPVGDERYLGVAWANMPDDVLQHALRSEVPEMTDAHKDAVRGEIERREGEEC